MQEILEELKKGNASIVDYFVEADKKWPELLSFIDNITAEELARKLTEAKLEFERDCGGNPLGKTVMGWSGFAHLYSCQVGFEENGSYAYKLAQAFVFCMCSMEVKLAAEHGAQVYSVNRYA